MKKLLLAILFFVSLMDFSVSVSVDQLIRNPMIPVIIRDPSRPFKKKKRVETITCKYSICTYHLIFKKKGKYRFRQKPLRDQRYYREIAGYSFFDTDDEIVNFNLQHKRITRINQQRAQMKKDEQYLVQYLRGKKMLTMFSDKDRPEINPNVLYLQMVSEDQIDLAVHRVNTNDQAFSRVDAAFTIWEQKKLRELREQKYEYEDTLETHPGDGDPGDPDDNYPNDPDAVPSSGKIVTVRDPAVKHNFPPQYWDVNQKKDELYHDNEQNPDAFRKKKPQNAIDFTDPSFSLFPPPKK